MKTKLVKRYYCDFCKKANCSSASIRKHENGCTNNPDRVCGFCRIAGGKQKTIAELIHAIGMDRAEFDRLNPNYPIDEWDRLEPEHLFAACNRCPACSLAAIRQSGSHDFVKFDFRDEVKSFFDEIHAFEERGC